MWLEVYQTVGASAGIAALGGVIAVVVRMSWQATLKIGLAGLVCVAVAWSINSDRDVSHAQAVLTSRSVNDPECRIMDLRLVDSTDEWSAIVCPKQPGRSL